MLDISLTVIQLLSVIVLALVGLISFTYDHEAKRLSRLGWTLVTCASITYILTASLKEVRERKQQATLIKKIEDLRDSLYEKLAPEVMDAPKEVSPVTKPQPTGQLQITFPKDSTRVKWRQFIGGTVADPKAEVWVIIHPVEVSAYWVQPPVTVGSDGTWKVMSYLGRSGALDVGKEFEVMAIANPHLPLKEGDVLERWPEAKWKSQVIVVKRG